MSSTAGSRSRAVSPCAQGGQQLRVLALLLGRLPVREGRPPAKLDAAAAPRRRNRRPLHIQRGGGLPVAEIRHERGEVGAGDDVEQPLLVDRQARPDLAQRVDGVDVGDDGVVAGPGQALVVEGPLAPRRMTGGSGTGIVAEGAPDLQTGDDPRHVRDQALRQVAGLGARIGDELLALAVIELLRHFQRLAPPTSRSASRTASAARAGRAAAAAPAACPRPARASGPSKPSAAAAIASASSRLRIRSFGACRIRNCTGFDLGRGDHLEIGLTGTKLRISSSRLQTMARVGVLTRPTPMTAARPRARITVAVRVRDRL